MAAVNKLPVEYRSDKVDADGKRKVVFRFVITDFKNLDEALARAKERAVKDGRQVQSANFRASKDRRGVDGIIVYVKEG